MAILDGIQNGRKELDKHQLFASMIANAWYTVNYFNVSFGQQDLIQSAVKQIKDLEGITIDAPKPLINKRLTGTNNPLTRKLLFHFDKQVPHWFLSPWYPKSDRATIYQYSQEGLHLPMYHLYKDRIVIQSEWSDYLIQHIGIVRDFGYWNLTLFLQARNPNVPDIPGKLIKPAIRSSLVKQRKFWDFVIDTNGPINCIYTGKKLHKGQYHVEHFIPYSFVSHDQIWNLIPCDNSFNISKSNKLPLLNEHFESFYALQQLAINTYIQAKPNEKLLEDYFYIGTDWREGLSKEKFYDVINPLVTIASNNGFEFLG